MAKPPFIWLFRHFQKSLREICWVLLLRGGNCINFKARFLSQPLLTCRPAALPPPARPHRCSPLEVLMCAARGRQPFLLPGPQRHPAQQHGWSPAPSKGLLVGPPYPPPLTQARSNHPAAANSRLPAQKPPGGRSLTCLRQHTHHQHPFTHSPNEPTAHPVAPLPPLRAVGGDGQSPGGTR